MPDKADLLVDMEEGETKAVPAVVFSAEAAGEDPPDPGHTLLPLGMPWIQAKTPCLRQQNTH